MISFCCVLFWIHLFSVVFLEWVHSIFSEILVILSLLLPHCFIPESDCSSWPKITGCPMCCTSVVPELPGMTIGCHPTLGNSSCNENSLPGVKA